MVFRGSGLVSINEPCFWFLIRGGPFKIWVFDLDLVSKAVIHATGALKKTMWLPSGDTPCFC